MSKLKVSITIAPDILEKVDRARHRVPGATRSSILDAWLRRALRVEAEAELRESTIRYYEGLTAEERREEEALARASSRATRKLDLDGSGRRRTAPRD